MRRCAVEHSANERRLPLGSRFMTRMHQERRFGNDASRHGVCPKWKRLLSIANLPRNVTAWLRTPRPTSIAKCCEKWLTLGQKSQRRRNKQKRRARRSSQCPLWVKSRHERTFRQCPLYPQKRTSITTVVMSALCQKQTYAVQQRPSLFDRFVGSN